MNFPQIEISVSYKGADKSQLLHPRTSKDFAPIMRELFDPGKIEWVEEMIMICLNQSGKAIGYYKVSSGGTTCTICDVKVLAIVALNCLATHVIIAHNHPSGSTKPSEADKAITHKIKEGLQLLDIKLVDHLIITTDSYFSFADEAYI